MSGIESTSFSEPSHSRERKPRLRKRKIKDEWGTTAESLIERFGTDDDDRHLIASIRTRLRESPIMRFEMRQLAHECNVRVRVFLTAAAIARKNPEKIPALARELEQLTSQAPNLSMKEAEVGYITLRLQKAVLPPLLQ